MRVPNSNVRLTLTQIRDLFTPPDWHPEDHPAMPPIVGKGRKPQVWACGYCHLPTGYGKPGERERLEPARGVISCRPSPISRTARAAARFPTSFRTRDGRVDSSDDRCGSGRKPTTTSRRTS